MGYYLIDNPNPHAKQYWALRGVRRSFWGYPERRTPIQGFVMHVPVAMQDIEGDDRTAEAVARFFATTSRIASAHVNIDADSAVDLLPINYTAFHAKGGNSNGIGMEIGWDHDDWGKHPNRDYQVIARAAEWAAPWAAAFQVPLRRVNANGWRNGMKGFISHEELDPTRRQDPGDNFPWDDYLGLIEMEQNLITKLTQQDIVDLKGILESMRRVGSNPTFVETLIKDHREEEAEEGDG